MHAHTLMHEIHAQAIYSEPATQSMCGRGERSDSQQAKKPKLMQGSFGFSASR
jgi:hypothetical protein